MKNLIIVLFDIQNTEKGDVMLPEAFKNRMRSILGDEYESFISALELPPVKGIRINTLKTSKDAFLKKESLRLTPLSYCDDGFIPEESDGIGNTPEHHSGQIYVQDPGAMSALSSLEIKEGWWVLDLCSAPGGKSSQAAAKIGDSGFLLSNEYVPKRAKICVANFERLGMRNTMVTSVDTSEFKKYFNSAFDLVIADAPCSGEGMFRKSDEAVEEWSMENIRLSQKRQIEILENAATLAKPGGYLIYSTCTYSIEENEMTVDAFLTSHKDYELQEVMPSLKAVTADGIQFDGAISKNLARARRFYPHIANGEGQFVALMKRIENVFVNKSVLFKSTARELSKNELGIINKFFAEELKHAPSGKIQKHNDNIVLITHTCPIFPKSVFSAGVLLGEIRKEVFHPSHQFFSAYGELFKNRETLSKDDPRLKAYLSGEEIESVSSVHKGYTAIFFEDTPLGGGKCSNGKIKNHYPKGLRILK